MIGVVAYGHVDNTVDPRIVCAKGTGVYARIRGEEIEWIKGYTERKALDSKCKEI